MISLMNSLPWVLLIAGMAIGALMGLTGAGGGILAVPLLVMVLGLPLQQATPMALLAVGLASALGAFLGWRRGQLRYRAATLMAVCGMLTAPVGVELAHRIPHQPLWILFAAILAWVSLRLLWTTKSSSSTNLTVPQQACHADTSSGRIEWTRPCVRALALAGASAGLLSGLLGVGGGFVLIPALIKHTDVPMRSIQVTTMAVIAAVSTSGVFSAARHGQFVGSAPAIFALAAAGTVALLQPVAQRLPAALLQRGFAILSLCVSALMAWKAIAMVAS